MAPQPSLSPRPAPLPIAPGFSLGTPDPAGPGCTAAGHGACALRSLMTLVPNHSAQGPWSPDRYHLGNRAGNTPRDPCERQSRGGASRRQGHPLGPPRLPAQPSVTSGLGTKRPPHQHLPLHPTHSDRGDARRGRLPGTQRPHAPALPHWLWESHWPVLDPQESQQAPGYPLSPKNTVSLQGPLPRPSPSSCCS